MKMKYTKAIINDSSSVFVTRSAWFTALTLSEPYILEPLWLKKMVLNFLLSDKILGLSKSKASADDIINVAKRLEFIDTCVETIV